MRKGGRKRGMGFELVCFYMVTCLMIVIFENVSQVFSIFLLSQVHHTKQCLAVSRFKGAGSLTEGQQ